MAIISNDVLSEKEIAMENVEAINTYSKFWAAWWDIQGYGVPWYMHLDMPDFIVKLIEKEWSKLPPDGEMLEIFSTISALIMGCNSDIEKFASQTEKEFRQKYEEAADGL